MDFIEMAYKKLGKKGKIYESWTNLGIVNLLDNVFKMIENQCLLVLVSKAGK